MTTVIGSIVDEGSGERIEARVQVLDSTGSFTHPPDAILKVGTGDPFFYSDGTFSVEVPRGKARIAVERGTEYVPADITIDAPSRGAVAVDIALRRWSSLSVGGWHPGNTHIHYDENEERPDDRLRLDPRIEDLRMTAVSILRRRGLDYATNKYPPGVLTEMSSPQHHVQCGQENRHNSSPWDIGYGHVMLLNVRNVVEPVSRGVLVDDFDPDYPPLIGVNYFCRSRCLKEYVTEAELLPHADVTEIRSLPHDCVTQIMEAWIWSQRSAQPRGRRFSKRSAAGTGRRRRETRPGCSTSSWPW